MNLDQEGGVSSLTYDGNTYYGSKYANFFDSYDNAYKMNGYFKNSENQNYEMVSIEIYPTRNFFAMFGGISNTYETDVGQFCVAF